MTRTTATCSYVCDNLPGLQGGSENLIWNSTDLGIFINKNESDNEKCIFNTVQHLGNSPLSSPVLHGCKVVSRPTGGHVSPANCIDLGGSQSLKHRSLQEIQDVEK